MSNLLPIQDNLLKVSAKELLRTDLLHLTTKEQNKQTEYAIDSYVLVHYRTGSPPTRLQTSWKGSKDEYPLYTTRPYNWQRDGLPRVRHEAICL